MNNTNFRIFILSNNVFCFLFKKQKNNPYSNLRANLGVLFVYLLVISIIFYQPIYQLLIIKSKTP
jgi:hypothetical protein